VSTCRHNGAWVPTGPPAEVCVIGPVLLWQQLGWQLYGQLPFTAQRERERESVSYFGAASALQSKESCRFSGDVVSPLQLLLGRCLLITDQSLVNLGCKALNVLSAACVLPYCVCITCSSEEAQVSQVVGLAGRHVTLSIKGDEVAITEAAAAATAEAHQQPGSESSDLAVTQASTE